MVKVFKDVFPAGIQRNKTDGYYMDENLKNNFDQAKNAIKDDWDMCFAIDGAEGSGKSVLAQQLAYYCDPTLTLDRIVFTGEDFKKAIEKSKKYQAIIYDEAHGGLAGKRTLSELNHSIVSQLTKIRRKNLYIFILLPTFFDLDKYVALWRSRALIHVYAPQFQRGFFKFYSYNKKKDLYVLGKKFYNYRVTEPDFSGRYAGFYTVNEEEYRNKKDLESEKEDMQKKEPTLTKKYRTKVHALIIRLAERKNILGLNQTQIAQALGVSNQMVTRVLNEHKYNNENV